MKFYNYKLIECTFLVDLGSVFYFSEIFWFIVSFYPLTPVVHKKVIHTCHVSEDIVKSGCSKEEAAQVGDTSRRIGRHADEKKVAIINLGCFNA